MKVKVIFLLICVSLNLANEIEGSREIFYVILGMTGTGKSEFINAITKTKNMIASHGGKSQTKDFKIGPFNYKDRILMGIDTPGLNDSNNNDEILEKLKKILTTFPRIQKIIIVKKYNDIRIDKSLQEAIKFFMEIFPLRNFWDYVIVVNTWADPNYRQFKNFMKEKYQSFSDKVNECNNLTDYMKIQKIQSPIEIKEFFVECDGYNEITGMNETFDEIRENIYNSSKMFKKIEKSAIMKRTKESDKNKGFYIITHYYNITFYDFNGNILKLEEITKIEEQAPCNSNFKETKTIVKKSIDDVRWYDFLSLGISWVMRNTVKYTYYKQNIYEIGDTIITGDLIYNRTEYKYE